MPAADNLAVRAALEQGDYAAAASEAAQTGDEMTAIDYFIKAHLPERAAGLALKRGDHRRAAEIYEQAHLYDKAALHYEKAGVPEKVQSMHIRKRIEEQPKETEFDVAQKKEAAFRELLAQNDTSTMGKTRLQQAARDGAEAFILSGHLVRAANIYRDSGLHDEAIHLFANLLGDRAAAARILLDDGRLEQAAELFELAGDGVQAATVLLQLAAAAPRPDAYIDRLVRSSPKQAAAFFEAYLAERGVIPTTVPVAEALSDLLLERGEQARANALLSQIVAAEATDEPPPPRARQATGPHRARSASGSHVAAERAARASIAPEAPSQASASAPPPAAEGQLVATAEATPAASSLPSEMPATPRGVQASVPPPARSGTDSLAPVLRSPGPSVAPPAIQDDEPALEIVLASGAAQQLHDRQKDVVSQQVRRLANFSGEFRAVASKQKMADGLDAQEGVVELLLDAATDAAKSGPSLAALQKFIGGKPCDLQNIEVFYRIGLLHLARGDWAAAQSVFDQVEDASAGYRDAWKRSSKILQWQVALGPKSAHFADKARYQFKGELGRSERAVVYRVSDAVFGRDVALKVYSGLDTAARDQLLGAAEVASDLCHPQLMQIYDQGVVDDKPYVVSEMVDGALVSSLMLEKAGLTIIESLRILEQVSSALEHAHDHHLPHGDIHPRNVMRSGAGVVKLMDAGLSPAGAAANGSRPRAPELRPGEASLPGDLYAFGVMGYELITNALPDTPPKPLRELFPSLPDAFTNLIMACLDADPNARPTIRMLNRTLKSLVAALGTR